MNWNLCEWLDEPAAREYEQTFASDAPGRSFDSVGKGRHAMEPEHSAKQQLRKSFAKRLATELESARIEKRFQNLVLIAAPAISG